MTQYKVNFKGSEFDVPVEEHQVGDNQFILKLLSTLDPSVANAKVTWGDQRITVEPLSKTLGGGEGRRGYKEFLSDLLEAPDRGVHPVLLLATALNFTAITNTEQYLEIGRRVRVEMKDAKAQMTHSKVALNLLDATHGTESIYVPHGY